MIKNVFKVNATGSILTVKGFSERPDKLYMLPIAPNSPIAYVIPLGDGKATNVVIFGKSH